VAGVRLTFRGWRWVAGGVAIVIAAAQAIRIAVNPVGDFRNHWEWGARFLRGEFLYDGGANIPYLPAWAMAFAPLSVLPLPIAQLLMYAIAFGAVWAVLSILDHLCRDPAPIEPQRRFWAATIAIVLTSRYLLRDLSEAGPNTILMALAWIGVWMWWRGRPLAGGAVLGAAIALKPTAAIFLLYFVFRRQWRFAAATGLAAAVTTALPAVWQGSALFGRHVEFWMIAVWSGVTSDDPRIGVLGLDPVGNVALRPALASYLTPVFPEMAAPIVAGVMACLAGAVAWSLRRGRTDLRACVAWDIATVAILALLLSPITWRQHCVAILPACYLIVRARLTGTPVPPIASFALGTLIVVSLILSRGVMGDTISTLVHAYYLHTLALLLLVAGVIACRNQLLRCRPATEPRSS
jgi:hypothetical protein